MNSDRYLKNRKLAGSGFDKEYRYWMNKLEGDIVMSTFPTVPCGSGTERCGRFLVNDVCSGEVYDRLILMARESDYGIYMILLAVMGYLLYRYTGNNDVVVGMPMLRSGQKSREVLANEPVSCLEQRQGSAASQRQDSLTLSCGGILLLRNAADGKMTFRDLLMEVNRTVTEADENSNFPFERLSGILGFDGRKSDLGPHIRTIVLLEQIHELKSLLNVSTDVVFHFSLMEKTLGLKAEYDASLYDQETMKQITGHFFRVLETVTRNPGIELSKIEILAEEEEDRLLNEYNDTRAEYPTDKTIHMLFCEQAARTPENTAVVLGDEWLNYRELDAASDRIAKILGGYGIRPDDIVGIMAHRSIETVAGILGILKAGGAYLPIDPEYPEERIGYMLDDSGAKVLLVQKEDNRGKVSQAGGQTGVVAEIAQEPEQGGTGADTAQETAQESGLSAEKGIAEVMRGPGEDCIDMKVPQEQMLSTGRNILSISLSGNITSCSMDGSYMDGSDGGRVCLAGGGNTGKSDLKKADQSFSGINGPDPGLSGSIDPSQVTSSSFDVSQATSGPTDLAYVIYTSGTTGRPKGVMIEHRNVVRLLFNDKIQYDFNDRDTWTLFHSFCFDFSVWEMYGALLYGGKLVIVPRPVAQDPVEYLKLLKQHRVTVLNQTPTAFYRLSEEEVKTKGKDLALRYVIFGGEALQPLMLKAWREKYTGVKLVNMYGITETTVHVTYKEITETEIGCGVSNIGKPIPTLTAYVMDRDMRLLPVGVAGELCVGGDGVGRGYLNRPELTREKFVDNPYKQGERLYRSGDLARLLPGGDMEYLGRIDQQVKIRGHRIELGEIEATVLSYGPVGEAVAVAGGDEDGNRHICVYYVSEKAISVGEFREYLAGKLPGYMIPSYFVRLERIPLTANNKVDRKALPKPGTGASTEEGYEAPADERELKLAEIWKDVLKLEKAGVCSNFFNTGGDSIKAITLVSRINREFGSNLQIKDIYMNQTIRELAGYLATVEGKGAGDELRVGLEALEEIRKAVLEDEKMASLLPGDTEDFYPLSPIQQGMVFFTQIMPEEPIYHDQFPYMGKIRDFDIGTFNEAMRLLAQRHPILRTTFRIEEFNEPIQVVHRVNGGILPVIGLTDLSGTGCEEQEEIIRAHMEEDLRNKFRFGNSVLWRMHVFGLGNDDYCIVPSYQHAALDGWSAASLMSELFEITDRLKNGEEYIAENLKSSYRDYVAYNLGRKASEKTREYWRETLKGYTRNKLPFNISNRKSGGEGRSRILRKDLDPGLLNKLEEKARKLNCTLQELCISAHTYLLCLTSGEEDIVTGVVTHDRPAVEDGDKVLGCFLNTLPLRVKVETGIRKADLLQEVKMALRNAKANDLFLADIAGIIGESNMDGNPVFDVIFNFMDFHVLKSVEKSGKVDRVENLLQIPSNEMTNTLLDIEISKTLDFFYLQVKYSPVYFSEEDMNTAADLYERILTELASDGGECLGTEGLLTEEEIQKLVYDFNDTRMEYAKDKTLHGLFEEQAAKTPKNIALVSGDMQLTYAELNTRANRLARLLMDRGVKNGDNVGLVARRGFDMITGMLAILKSGGAYIPIDPDYPASRQEYIAANSAVAALVVDGDYGKGNGKGAFKETALEEAAVASETVGRCETDTCETFASETVSRCETDTCETFASETITRCETETCENNACGNNTREIVIRIDHGEMEGYDGGNINLNKDSKDLAYVIYTSGSTGNPKGVMIEHHSAVNLISWVNREFSVGENDALLFLTSMCFDLSVYDIFGILASGGRVVIAGREQVQNPAELERLLTDYQITFWDSVPSTMNFLVNYLETGNESYTQNQLRLVFMSGDWIPVNLPGKLKRYFPGVKVISLGGATEGTIWSNWYPVTTVGEDWASIPYGKPIANNRFYILDKSRKLVPKGVAGELYIGGVGVARGYMNEEEKTKASFMRDLFLDSPYAMMYRTGDLGRMLPDWNMEFLGRKDHQVKIRGYRVELGEVESKLLKHPAVREAVAVDRMDAEGGKYLCAYLVWEEEQTVSQMRDFLSKELPDYMVPSCFIGIDAIPLTANGKVDRKALPEPGEHLKSPVTYEAPQNADEEKLVKIWEDVLNARNIDVNDNFFDVGGYSLNALKIVERAKKENMNLSIGDIFRYKSIRQILRNAVSDNNGSGEKNNTTGFRENVGKNGKVLKYTYQKKMTSYLFRSLLVGIVVSYEKLLPWYYQHFIQICSQTDDDGSIVIDYAETIFVDSEVVEHVKIGYAQMKDVTDITGLIIEKISKEQYVIICMDEYSLSEKQSYHKEHFVHESLIFGYDDVERKFIGYGFDRDRLMNRLVFSYDEVKEAFESGKIYYPESAHYAENQAFQYISLIGSEVKQTFDMSIFIKELSNYVYSTGDNARCTVMIRCKDIIEEKRNGEKHTFLPFCRMKFGLAVYEDILSSFEKVLEGKISFDYRLLHMFAEHKKILLERLDFITANYHVGKDTIELIEEYGQIADMAEGLRIKAFEAINSNQLCQSDTIGLIMQVLEKIKLIRKNEEEVLSQVLHQLESFCGA